MSDFIYTPPLYPNLDVIYQDDDLVVVNKPSGLLSVPGRLKENKDSIISRLQAINKNAMPVHRLDMDTSGLMVVALSKRAVSALGKAFINKEVKKFYLALVSGVPQKTGEILLPIRCDIENRPLQIVDFEYGKPSHTIYKRIDEGFKIHPSVDFNDCSVVKLTPVTGRSHQLRVHMASVGHQILGDRFYADENVIKKAARLCLHAAFLSFTHPFTGEVMTFTVCPDFLYINSQDLKKIFT